ncbi:hypothetical protein BU17DRAFT_64638 [Hysterangium stoloniferum]|nr:hypothetical protein BU17DRAFT_64638 [Hysterangium stoloniferum]
MAAGTASMPQPPKPNYDAIYGGLAGGGLVLVGTYAWYHLSGTKKVIQTEKATIDTAQEAKDKFQQVAPAPREALMLLKSAMKMVAPSPGIDYVFDQFERMLEKHGDRMGDIVVNMYGEMREALEKGDPKDAGKIMINIITKRGDEIRKLGTDIGTDVLGSLLDKSPELRRVLGGSYDRLKSTADKVITSGPEAKRIVTDTANQAASILNGGINATSVADAAALLQQKSKEFEGLASRSSSDAWKAARNNAQPILDNLPHLKNFLDENVESLKDYVEERVKIVKEQTISKSSRSPEEKQDEAEKIVKEKMNELRGQNGVRVPGISDSDLGQLDLAGLLSKNGGIDKLKAVLGFGGIAEEIAKLQELQSTAEKRGPEAKKLLDETSKDIKIVLESKIEEARKIGQGAKEDVEKQKSDRANDKQKGDS